MSVAHPPHPELVLLCGGTEQQRAKLRRVHSAMIDSRTAVTARDVHSLLHWAPRSRAVIVCGELAGIGEATLERLVREHAPAVVVIAGDARTDARPLVGVELRQQPTKPSPGPPVPVAKRRLALA